MRFKPILKEHGVIIRQSLRRVHDGFKAEGDRVGVEDVPEGGSCLHGSFVRVGNVGCKGFLRVFCVESLGKLRRGWVR